MIRNIHKYVSNVNALESFDDEAPIVTESEDLAIKTGEQVIQEEAAKAEEQQQENANILEQKDEDIENIKEQAEEPFDPDKIDSTDSQDSDENQSDSEGELNDDSQTGDDLEGADDTVSEDSDEDKEAIESGDVGGDEEGDSGADSEGVAEGGSSEGMAEAELDSEDSDNEDESDTEETESDDNDESDSDDEDSDSEESEDDDNEDFESEDNELGDDEEVEPEFEDLDDEDDSDELEFEEADDERDSDEPVEDSEESEDGESDEESEDDSDSGDDDDSEDDDSDSDEEGDLGDDEVEVEDVDLTTTDDEVEEAEDEADEAEAEAEELEEEIIDDSKTLEDLERETKSVEEYIQFLKVAISREQFEPMFMVSVDSKLQAYRKVLGLESDSVPALEDYNSEVMGKHYYVHSLESFESIRDKLQDLHNSVTTKMMEKIRIWTSRKVEPRIKAINKKIDNSLGKLTVEDDDFKTKLRFFWVDTNRRSITDVIGSDLKTINRVTNQLLKPQLALQENVGKILLAATKVEPSKIEDEVKKVLNIKPIDFKDIKDFETIKDVKVFRKKVKEPSDRVFDQIVTHLGKSTIKLNGGGNYHFGDQALHEYTKDDLIKILTLCKVYTALAIKVKETHQPKIIDLAKRIDTEYVKALDKQFSENIENEDADEEILEKIYMPHAILYGMKDLNKYSLEVYKFIVSHILTNMERITNRIANRLK